MKSRADRPRLTTTAYRDSDHVKRKEKQFEKEYGFVKGIPPRSIAGSAWEHEAIEENQPFMDGETKPYLEKEHRLIAGTPHSFGHAAHQRQGHLRTSGTKGAYQIGKRK